MASPRSSTVLPTMDQEVPTTPWLDGGFLSWSMYIIIPLLPTPWVLGIAWVLRTENLEFMIRSCLMYVWHVYKAWNITWSQVARVSSGRNIEGVTSGWQVFRSHVGTYWVVNEYVEYEFVLQGLKLQWLWMLSFVVGFNPLLCCLWSCLGQGSKVRQLYTHRL